ncbi:allantoinase AllB [Nesterenkonia sp. HG001]|uniref:allantoinase AllB n=1 Tax=Nesterenkonia sp. HG001 TaxID=2983207 RepID=UPI002AC44040|nr:allantoinase AllB [Nesterenkonia sp. HG001]MDZ5078940.1 allantoinase AllB [Nesterenkonia sp. HG001]
MVHELVVTARRALLPEGWQAVEIGVDDGTITALAPYGAGLQGRQTRELREGQVLLPGLVDTHVHVNEPGRTEWEGFASATRAAAAGGVTTIVDMPLNSIPPTVDPEALQIKQAAAAASAHVDVGFWGGAVPGNGEQLRPLHERGVFGFKCFLEDSGVEEFPPLEPAEMEEDMAILAELGSMMIVHAEDHDTLAQAPGAQGRRYEDFLRSRPREAENVAIRAVIDAARRTGARAHILHLSSADALPEIRQARAEGVKLTVETCPHYLVLAAEEIGDGATTHKCCPPIREASNQHALWEGLREGLIDCVVSDHSPSTAELKLLDVGDFGAAWGGISSLQLGLPLVWSEARARGLELEQVVGWMSSAPADLAGLSDKGRLAEGKSADMVIFSPEQSWSVEVDSLWHRNKVSAYDGRDLVGVVESTLLRGEQIDFETPRGRLISRVDAKPAGA